MNEEVSVVGVAGTTETVGELADELAASGPEVVVDAPTALQAADVDLIVAVGEDALTDVIATAPTIPVVPVELGAGIRAVSRDAVDEVGAAIAAGEWRTESHRPIVVTVDGDPIGTAAFDVTLVTTEAARISEYTVHAGERIDRARADGVVVATPAGSTGYARRIEAPVLAPGTGLAVAWIAPFRSDPNRWVLNPASLSIAVERDDAAVDLLVDGRLARSVGPHDEVTLRRGDPFTVAVFGPSRNRYE